MDGKREGRVAVEETEEEEGAAAEEEKEETEEEEDKVMEDGRGEREDDRKQFGQTSKVPHVLQ